MLTMPHFPLLRPIRSILLAFGFLLAAPALRAETITYRIVEYNADAGSFVLAASGMRPVGSYAIFENDFGATRGNRYNQIPRNKQATLWLEGWGGCTINSVTLAMCSNNTSGTAALNVTSGDTELFTMRAADFASDEWFGHWLSKDLRTYAEITKTMTSRRLVGRDEEVAITLKGGTPEGSVYLDAVTIDYTPSPEVGTESPLGWVFEKLEAKSTLSDGDVIMLYRSGDAAGDIDGMEQSHYLDAIGLASTSNVVEPFVLTFTAQKTRDGHWTLTNQYGQQLAATGAQALTWIEASDATAGASAPSAAALPLSVEASASYADAVTTWDITLGYSGATIASTNSKYGTLRYNAPAESYPRFWNYTSTSLPLPYIYRRTRQLQPVLCQSLEILGFSSSAGSTPDGIGTTEGGYGSALTVDLAQQDTLLLRPEFHPSNVTSRRLIWESSNPEVATVRSGVVFLHAPGRTTISASCLDWTPSEIEDGAMADIPPTAYIDIIVDDATASILSLPTSAATPSLFDVLGRRVIAPPSRSIYIDSGILRIR